MFEDLAGTQSAGTGRTYVTCEECGQVFARETARPEASGLTDSAHSEWTDVCPDCERLNSQGERPILEGAPHV
jgi:hypothetical protein